jgi:predicted DNA-binding transcriptional regulator YafY
MSRSARLLELLQALRRHRRPVTGQVLADEIGVSLRTLYRDIASLQDQGAEISGEAGIGYVLQPGFMLPPLMFPPEELEALALGLRWVAGRADERLAAAASSARARVAAVLPREPRDVFETSTLLVAPGLVGIPRDVIAPEILRRALRGERKLRITYNDLSGVPSERIVWPFAIAYFDQARVLMAWCELRADFRNFRTDRIASAEVLDARYPKRRQALLEAWRKMSLRVKI